MYVCDTGVKHYEILMNELNYGMGTFVLSSLILEALFLYI